MKKIISDWKKSNMALINYEVNKSHEVQSYPANAKFTLITKLSGSSVAFFIRWKLELS